MHVCIPLSWLLDSTVTSITFELFGPSARTGITIDTSDVALNFSVSPLEFPLLPLAHTAHPPQAALHVFQVRRPLHFHRADLLGSCAFWNLGRHPHTADIDVLVLRAPSPILTLQTVDVILD